MNRPTPLSTATLHVPNLISRSPLRSGLLLIAVALCCFALSPAPNAFGVSPAPDGGYPGANTAEGTNALNRLTTTPPDGGYPGGNTAEGTNALNRLTTGTPPDGGYPGANTAEGQNALQSLSSGTNNTALGYQTLFSNTAGGSNTAAGYRALALNKTGSDNTATGYRALYSNTTMETESGSNNTANGSQALYSNTTGGFNTANGVNALYSNTTGSSNAANGVDALYSNTDANENTATGYRALYSNTTGSDNIALGSFAGFHLTTGSNNIDIGNQGVAGESETIRIGRSGQTRAFIAGIRGVTTGNANAVPVVIDSAGQLGTMSSSRRFKKEIKPMDQTSQAILALQPVTFRYKSDPGGTAQFGLIAEEVAEVDPDLVVRDAEGEIYSVRYEAVNAMLLNEFLKEHRTVQELESTVAKQEATIAELKQDFESELAEQHKQIKALMSGLEKVNNELETSKPAPQMVLNSQ